MSNLHDLNLFHFKVEVNNNIKVDEIMGKKLLISMKI
jgi:hypothetical protein